MYSYILFTESFVFLKGCYKSSACYAYKYLNVTQHFKNYRNRTQDLATPNGNLENACTLIVLSHFSDKSRTFISLIYIFAFVRQVQKLWLFINRKRFIIIIIMQIIKDHWYDSIPS